jgi:hypothetical protein
MVEVFVIIGFVIVFLAFRLVVPQFFTRRALKPVIARFREHHALDAENARSIEALGLGPLAFVDRIMRLRDYKPKALAALIQGEIVLYTENGNLYLSEKRLAESPLGRQFPHLVEDAQRKNREKNPGL